MIDLTALRSLLAAWTIGREKRLLSEDDVLFWQLYVDGEPTTVPQTCAEFHNRGVDLPIIVAAVNALPALLEIAQAAQAVRDHWLGSDAGAMTVTTSMYGALNDLAATLSKHLTPPAGGRQ